MAIPLSVLSAGEGPSVLVTGAGGFIGSCLVQVLRVRGFRVHALVRDPRRVRHLGFPEARIRVGDLRDGPSLAAAVEGMEFVFHLAGATRAFSLEAFLDANARGVGNLVRACRRAAPGLRRFVLVSSLAAHGPARGGGPAEEMEAPRPISWYGLSKLHGEDALQTVAGVPFTIIRPPIVYGPRERDLLALFRMAARPGGIVPVAGSRAIRYSFIHAEDLCAGLIAAATDPRTLGRTYFLGGPEDASLQEFVETIGRALGRKVRVITVPGGVPWVVAGVLGLGRPFRRRPALLNRDRLREMRGRMFTAASERFAADTGFRAGIGLLQGIRATVEAYRREGLIGGQSGDALTAPPPGVD